MRITWLALATAVVLAASCSASGKPSLVMHRQTAGEADADGWYPARSTRGGFAVRLPAQFNDFSISGSRLDTGHEADLDVVGTKIQGAGKFSATCMRYRGQAPDRDQVLAPFAAGAPFHDARGEGRRLRSAQGQTQVYALPGRTCLLVVEVYDAAVVTEDVVEQFFGSFAPDP